MADRVVEDEEERARRFQDDRLLREVLKAFAGGVDDPESGVPTAEVMDQAIRTTVGADAAALFDEWCEESTARLAQLQGDRAGFQARLLHPWGYSLDLLDLLLMLVLEAGSEFNQRHRPAAAAEKDYLFEAETRLHARACQVGHEVVALLRAGLASGALARWRTLHETVVVAHFLKQHDQDLSERYLLHHHVAAARALPNYQTYCGSFGWEPFPEEEAEEIQLRRDQLVSRFGKGYASEYGWAAQALGNSQPTFAAIEEATDMADWRPYYRMASYGVHAGAKSVTFNLGLKDDSEMLIAGPSNLGIHEPGWTTVMSLVQIAGALLTLRLDAAAIASFIAITELATDVARAFVDASEVLEQAMAEEQAEDESDQDRPDPEPDPAGSPRR